MSTRDYRLAAIMFTDIAGFAAMLDRDEAASLELLRFHNQLITDTAVLNGGRVIKTVGDAMLCEFSNTVNATRSAIQIQEAIAARNREHRDFPLHLRVGIHLGDIHFLDDDAVGEGVTIAGHLESVARPGRICISQDVVNLVASKIPFQASPLGEISVKKVSRSIQAYEITVDPDAEPEGEVDINRLKTMVLQEIKRAGRRVSLDEIRDRIPQRSDAVDRALESLADKGLLTRVGSGKNRDYGPVHPSVEISTPGGVFTPEELRRGQGSGGPRPPRPPRVGYRQQESWGRSDRWESNQEADSEWDRALADPSADAGGYDRLVEDYKDHAAGAAEKEKAGFRGHLISYLAVNAGLFFLYSATMFGGFPWFLIVAGGWGIGLVSHYAHVREKTRESRELDQFQGLTREQLRLYRKLVKARSGFTGHLASNVATSAFLLGLNLMVSPGFLWAVFPIGFMAIGLLSHLPVYRSKVRRLIVRLRDAGANVAHLLKRSRLGQDTQETVPRPAADGASGEAEATRGRIVALLDKLPDDSPIGGEFTPVLDNYVEQIKTLDQKNRELDAIMRQVPLAELERDLLNLQKSRAEATDAKVIAEYDNHVVQIQKQQSSYGELRNEREILRLRLSSSLNQLKQMEIDLARMKSLSTPENAASISLLKDKSEELSQYLDDLEQGYRELE